MKSLHKIILFALLPLMGACSGMLDIEPHSAVSPTVVGSDDIEALRIGMYNKVQEGPTYYSYIAFDLFGGELMTSTGRPIDLINSLSNALHTFVSSQWNGYYKALLQVNNVMSIAEGLADSPTRNRVLGECRYFRAYIYLCLVTRFGDVPVLRQNTQAKVSRDPASMAWELVEEDLDAASGFLNGLSADSFYYVSPAAVTALKARVKLYLGKKGEAKELAESLIANPNYALDDFDKIFRSKANKEVIFAVHQANGEAVNGPGYYLGWNSNYVEAAYQNNPVPITGGNQWWWYTDRYKALLTSVEGDTRTKLTYNRADYGTTIKSIEWTEKGVGQMISGARIFDSDFILYRYAEAFLMDAEIKYYRKDYGGALTALGEITKRAYGNAAHYTDPSDAAVKRAIVEESLKELVGEGRTWWTLIRLDAVWDYNKDVADKRESNANILLWPITQESIIKNSKLKQTEGWY